MTVTPTRHPGGTAECREDGRGYAQEPSKDRPSGQGHARREKRQGVDEDIAALTEYDAATECILWRGPMHATGRYPVLDPDGDYFAVKTYLFRGLPGAKRPGCITVWASTCGDRRCVSFVHAEVRSYHPKRRDYTRA